MKTNHQRQYSEKPDRYRGGRTITARSELSDVTVAARIDYDHAQGNRGEAKDVRGAKKFLRSRIRFHDKAAVRKMTGEDE